MVATKRQREQDDADHGTPHQLRATIADNLLAARDALDAQTPSRTGRVHLPENGTPRSILKKTAYLGPTNGTPKSTRKLLFETPTKSSPQNHATTLAPHADRSARKKSNRRMLARAINGVESEDEILDEEDELAEEILHDKGPVREPVQHDVPEPVAGPVPETPVKRGRGRPKGTFKHPRPPEKIDPDVPGELPPHEEYFWQNRTGGNKTSNNTLSAQSLLNHEEYFEAIKSYQSSHVAEMHFLLQLHQRAFDQWLFELEEGFNLCLYGYGSKRTLTDRFTAHVYKQLRERAPYKGTKKSPKIVVINAYTAGTVLKDILMTIASTVVPTGTKLPNQPSVLLDYLLDHLLNHPPPHPIPVIINSIDSPSLRKNPTPTLLARLAAHASISLICTADTPNFPLLWDVGLKTQYRFLFHDSTTFSPYDAELDAVECVNDLLGRSGRRVGGRDGIAFVLRSLPENGRSLFRILVMEQLSLSSNVLDKVDGSDDDEVNATPRKEQQPKTASAGVEYRVLYHKAVGEFVCSSEVGFRTLLKEFHDHQMVESRKDGMGAERLLVPFRREELEDLAVELAGEVF